LLFWLAIFIALTVAVVIGVIAKRRIERQEVMLGLRHELHDILNEAQELLAGVEEPDLNSLEKLAQLKSQLEDMLARLEKVEQLYGQALARGDTDSDSDMLEHMTRGRGAITVTLERIRTVMNRLKNESKR